MGVYDQTKYMLMLRECFCFDFCFGTACGTIVCSGLWHNYFMQVGQAVRTSAQSIFLRCLWAQPWVDLIQLFWRKSTFSFL